MFEEIRTVINDITDIPIEDILPESVIVEDLDLASMESMSILAEIESKNGIKITNEEMLDISTIGDLVELVCKKIEGDH